MSYIYLAIGIIIGWFINILIPSYFKQKGKNLATKEDISKITSEVEKTKSTYIKEIEELKADLQVNIGHTLEKRNSYARVSSILHQLYLNYTDYIENLIVDYKKHGYPCLDKSTIDKKDILLLKFSELENIVIEESLYLKPTIIQELFDLGQIDLNEKIEKSLNAWENINEGIKDSIQEGEIFWNKCKKLMNLMRKDLNLDLYSEDILNFKRYFNMKRL